MDVYEIILTVIGVLMIIFSFIMNTKNIKSALLLKLLPFTGGCYCIFFALITSGIIKINL